MKVCPRKKPCSCPERPASESVETGAKLIAPRFCFTLHLSLLGRLDSLLGRLDSLLGWLERRRLDPLLGWLERRVPVPLELLELLELSELVLRELPDLGGIYWPRRPRRGVTCRSRRWYSRERAVQNLLPPATPQGQDS